MPKKGSQEEMARPRHPTSSASSYSPRLFLQETKSTAIGVLFGCLFGRKTDGDSRFTWWFSIYQRFSSICPQKVTISARRAPRFRVARRSFPSGWTVLSFLERMKFGDGAEDVANLFEPGSLARAPLGHGDGQVGSLGGWL